MKNQYATIDITFKMDGTFDINGDVKPECRTGLIETFLSRQLGKGEDERKPDERGEDHIRMRWNPDRDFIEVTDNTGNKGLRDGILYYVAANYRLSVD